MPHAADDRLETLEVKLAHLERAVQDLSDVVWRQQRQLDAADARHQQLLDRLSAADRGDDGAPPAQFEVPPHY
jgi:SlyX protein